ncbi:40S ribosomal protein S11-like [Teleopsis dalmanni]|uniref:40S ribosomal protein S11-like n=1 Tax=Teleopsis dalmanni TaxID=139649 RepID=UPI0018CD4EE5|nr:40S ribosomal protein S11-like [Teleopsis dalmanni]XP_037954263.1 40S ribosomal protein S11-like [Teleopsis dalmanni]
MADVQNERSYLKQDRTVVSKLGKSKVKKRSIRRIRSIGLGFKTPNEAIHGTYVDKKCPFTGNIRIRGRILTGTVVKTKMQKTIVVRREYLHYVRKYNRFEKRHRNISAHISPCFSKDVKIGDIAIIGECRPLSKTIRFNVLKLSSNTKMKKKFQKF